MARHPMHPLAPFVAVWRRRHLVAALARRDIAARYRGSAIGLAWSMAQPLAMLAIYTFVFGVIYRTEWPGGDGSRGGFALALFAGLLAIGLFSDCVARAPSLVVGNPNFVKRVVFPLEILSWVSLGSAAFQCCVGLVVWCGVRAALIGPPPATALLAPIFLAPVALLGLGVSWLLAGLAVYVRDVAQLVGVGLAALTFASPVFFPSRHVPEPFRAVVLLNPLAAPIEMTRDAMLTGALPTASSLAIAFAVAFAVAWLGFAFFQLARRGFADAL
ncbi:MAG: ABC transporter permease [Alphaproteobacteria bacterium]|nr:ABC transporter permease [Alphaproteobacteria bacterium]